MKKNTIILAILSVVLFSCKQKAPKKIKDDIKGIGVFTLGSHKSQYSDLIQGIKPYILYDNVQSYQRYSVDYKFNDSLDLVEVELNFYNDTLWSISIQPSSNVYGYNSYKSTKDIYNILKLKYPNYIDLETSSKTSWWNCKDTSYTMSGDKDHIELYNGSTLSRVIEASKYIPIEKMKGL
jgi:hypothetical protein